MVRVVVNPETESKLVGVRHVTEVCDASGRVLGHFVPKVEAEVLDPGVSDEELDRREREESGRPLADILADLRKRA